VVLNRVPSFSSLLLATSASAALPVFAHPPRPVTIPNLQLDLDCSENAETRHPSPWLTPVTESAPEPDRLTEDSAQSKTPSSRQLRTFPADTTVCINIQGTLGIVLWMPMMAGTLAT
jgi:hypothetical protein